MAIRTCILLAVVASVFIVTSADDHNEVSSSAQASSSSNGSSAKAYSSSQSVAKSATNKKCKKVKKCPKNEEFSYCPQSISRAQLCSQKGQQIRSRNENRPCKEGCVCKEGFLRNVNGTCIPARKCGTDCAPSETLDQCPVDSPSDYCPTSEDESAMSVSPDKDDCAAPVCKCRFNYRRLDNGSCISTRDCPPFDCSSRPYEEFNPCPPLCPSDDCSEASPSGKCPKIGRIGIVLECTPKCRCIKGYWRKDGICVPYEKCLADETPTQCGSNEEVRCVQSCPPEKTCRNRGIEFSCIAQYKPCQNKCVCKEGYYKNFLGECITGEQCDQCSGKNEFFACNSECDNECSKLNEQNRTDCPLVNVKCYPSCYCDDGFARDDQGNCIPVEKCPAACPANEEYVPCIQGVCRAMNCSQIGKDVPCPDMQWPQEQCDSGCICKENYYRNEFGTCVTEDQCQTKVCPQNEEYSTCTQTICRAQNCSQKGMPVPCASIQEGSCKTGCVCKEGFLRVENRTCVPEDQCGPRCPNPHEKYAISRIPQCPLLGTCTSITARIACDKPEVPGCICEDGYLRLNQTSPCIPTCECPQLANSDACQYS